MHFARKKFQNNVRNVMLAFILGSVLEGGIQSDIMLHFINKIIHFSTSNFCNSSVILLD